MHKIINYKKLLSLGLIVLSLIVSSCKKFIEIPPPATELIQQYVFEDNATALAAVASVYSKLSVSSFADGGFNSITIFEALYADELTSYAPVNSTTALIEFYLNNVTVQNGLVSSTWSGCYAIIYECNRILEGLEKSTNVTLSQKKQLSGEALFIRAFCHFYLVNLYGDVPLITTSDYRINAHISRMPFEQVYSEIIADLLKAKNLLVDTYPSADRVRVNKGAAIALLARAYLYADDFANAEAQATELINKTPQYKLLTSLNTIFLKTSEEAIWQILPKGGTQNYTNEGALFILLAPPTSWALRNELYSSFELNDLRKKYWVDSIVSSSGLTKWYYSYKYKERSVNATGSEYSMALRLAEQYLIRAEARAKQNKLTGPNSATSDINIIRTRAGLGNIAFTTQSQLLNAIEQERRVELFTEWGHRFFDLKRWGRLNAVLGPPVKLNWNTTDALLPIPQSEILLNHNLTQNPGY